MIYFLGAKHFFSFYKLLLYKFSFIDRIVCIRLGVGNRYFSLALYSFAKCMVLIMLYSDSTST